MNARTLLFALLAVVAGAAAVLSFAALDELGALCGFGALSPLLPVVIDAGAAAGSVAWLARGGGEARSFGRILALLLLGSSVAGNALSHALSAYAVTPTWGVVVAVSAVPPAVLGAVVHLAVLATSRPAETDVEARAEVTGHQDYPDPGAVDDHGLSWAWATAPPATDRVGDEEAASPSMRAAELIAAGAGRRRLARELDISEHQARELLAATRNGVTR